MREAEEHAVVTIAAVLGDALIMGTDANDPIALARRAVKQMRSMVCISRKSNIPRDKLQEKTYHRRMVVAQQTRDYIS